MVEESWREIERRKNGNGGWTMAREIIGTIIGMLAVLVPLGVMLVGWGSHVESTLSSHAISIDYIHQQALRQEQISNSNDNRMDNRLIRIEDKIDKLSQQTHK